jgi:DNA-binding response OmpR family regulator
MRILAIDDDMSALRALQRSLPFHDVSIETDPSNATAIVEAADVDGEPFELVLCGTNGLDVLARLRAGRQPPMLLLMCCDDDLPGAGAIADSVLLKPFQLGEIVDAVTRIRVRRSRAQTRRLPRVPRATAKLACNDGA